jgi:hypothetical protein
MVNLGLTHASALDPSGNEKKEIIKLQIYEHMSAHRHKRVIAKILSLNVGYVTVCVPDIVTSQFNWGSNDRNPGDAPGLDKDIRILV